MSGPEVEVGDLLRVSRWNSERVTGVYAVVTIVDEEGSACIEFFDGPRYFMQEWAITRDPEWGLEDHCDDWHVLKRPSGKVCAALAKWRLLS